MLTIYKYSVNNNNNNNNKYMQLQISIIKQKAFSSDWEVMFNFAVSRNVTLRDFSL
jgi:hypothetical protein